LLAAFFLFCKSPSTRKRRREEAKEDPPVPCYFLRQRVGSVSGVRAWRRRAATVPATPECLPCNSRIVLG